MTNKQIIIDGFNLEYIKELLCNGQRSAITTNIFEAIIEELEHKEQECEGLNKTITNLENIRDEFSAKLDQLKAENEELKKTIDDLLHKPEIQDKILWKIDNEALLRGKDAWIYKLEQTLTEIKEFVENEMTPNCDTSIILQKINEVKNEFIL